MKYKAHILLMMAISLSIALLPAAHADEPEDQSKPEETDPAKALWTEVPAPVPIEQRGVILELVVVDVDARPGGPIEVNARYQIANPAKRGTSVRVAIPKHYEVALGYPAPETTTKAGFAASDPPVLSLGDPPEEQPRDSLVPVTLPDSSPYGAVPGLAFAVRVAPYESAVFTLRWSLSWTEIDHPQHFPSEAAFSVSLAPLAAWGEGCERISVRLDFTPPLLGPASYARPLPYKYDSRGLEWTLRMPTADTLESAERVLAVVFDHYHEHTFESLFYARFKVDSDEYPWGHRFLSVSPLSQGAGGDPVLARAKSGALIKRLEEIENLILARNGMVFEDTFLQLRYQEEPWYHPNSSFSESSLRPVARRNLEYARCAGRAARSLCSALDKMEVDEIGAEERRARFLLTAFERCEERFWQPKQKTQSEGLRLD